MAVILVLMAVTGILGGGYFLFASALMGVVLSGMILYRLFRERKIRMAVDLNLLAFSVLAISYLVVSLWAVDTGMAPLGFVKFLPLLLFYVYVSGKEEEREKVIQMLPVCGSVMTVLSALMMQIPAVKPWVSVAGRLAGFFQYPNTYALFMLVCLVITAYRLKGGRTEKRNFVHGAIAAAGIYMSGSRTVFVLTVVTAVWLFVSFGKGHRKLLLGAGGILALSAVIVLLFGGEMAERFMAISVNSSTFLGRLLYAKDAIPVIVSHPFGLGYYGYYFIQQSIQTGVYSVVHAHNELMQMFLDVGVIPAVLMCAAAVRSVISRQTNARNRVVLAVMILHSLFDYDFQFLVMGFVWILFLDMRNVKECQAAGLTRFVLGTAGAGAAIFSVVAGASDLCHLSGKTETALKLYGGNTMAELDCLQKADTAEEMTAVSENLLSRNPHLSVAYSAKARAAFSEGDVKGFIENKQTAIQLAPYQYGEYLDYLQGLAYSEEKYLEIGSVEDAAICVQKAEEIPELLKEVRQKTSAIAWKIKDKPQVELSEGDLEMIERMRKNLGGTQDDKI